MAHCLDIAGIFQTFNIMGLLNIKGEIRKAVDEYRRLLADNDRGIVSLSNQLLSAIYARLGRLLTNNKKQKTIVTCRNIEKKNIGVI